MAMKKASEKVPLTYKGKQITRADRKIYIGNPGDRFFAELTVLESEQINEIEISTSISVKLMEKVEENVTKEIKKEVKDGLFTAAELGIKWLFEAQPEQLPVK